MKTIRPGYCVRLGADYNELIRHSSIVHPNGHVFTDDLKEAWRFKQAFPHVEVAHRWTKEEKLIPSKITPEKWMRDRLADLDALRIPYDAIVIHTSNEPDITPELVAWECGASNFVLSMTGKRPRLLQVNNAVGRPSHRFIADMHDILEICVKHPEQFYLGNHGYAPTLWTIGVNGTVAPGYNERFKPPANAQGTEAAIQPEKWPIQITNNACWYMSRWRFIAQYCHDQWKAMPAIWESECGFDDIKDVEWWQQSLPRPMDADGKTPKRLAGWKTNELAWRKFWPHWSTQQALWEQTKAFIEVCYETDFVADDGTVYETPVKIVTLFGVSPVDWADYDYGYAISFKNSYETHIAEQNIVVTKPIESFVKKPVDARTPSVNTVTFRGDFKNLRSGPGTDYADIGDIANGSRLKMYEPTRIAPNGSRWRWVEETPVGDGWFCIDGITFTPYVTPVEPVPEAPIETLPPPSQEEMPPPPRPGDAIPLPQEPPGREKPVYNTYGFNLNVTIKAETEEAANAVVAYIIQTGAARLQQLKHDQNVMKYLPLIEGSQFSMKVNL